MEELDKSTQFTVHFTYSSNPLQFKCDINEKIENIINKISSKIYKDPKTLIFLYNGNILNGESFQKTFSQVINQIDRKSKMMNILIYHNDFENIDSNNINIKLVIDSKQEVNLQGKREEKLRTIIEKGKHKIGAIFNQLIFTYRNKEINLDQKIDDIIDEDILKNKLFPIMANIKEQIIVHFVNYNYGSKRIICFPEDKLKIVCRKYSKKKD